MIILNHIGTYKDGGSKSYRDKDQNKYWLCRNIGEKNNPKKYNKLFKGDINKKPHVLAKGTFKLVSTGHHRHLPSSKIIKQ